MNSIGLIRICILGILASYISASIIPSVDDVFDVPEVSGSGSLSASGSLGHNIDEPQQILTFPQPRPTPPPMRPPPPGPCYHGGAPHPHMPFDKFREHQRRAIQEVMFTFIPLDSMGKVDNESLAKWVEHLNKTIQSPAESESIFEARDLYQMSQDDPSMMNANHTTMPADQPLSMEARDHHTQLPPNSTDKMNQTLHQMHARNVNYEPYKFDTQLSNSSRVNQTLSARALPQQQQQEGVRFFPNGTRIPSPAQPLYQYQGQYQPGQQPQMQQGMGHMQMGQMGEQQPQMHMMGQQHQMGQNQMHMNNQRPDQMQMPNQHPMGRR